MSTLVSGYETLLAKILIMAAFSYLIVHLEIVEKLLEQKETGNIEKKLMVLFIILASTIASLLAQEVLTELYLVTIIIAARVFASPWGLIAGVVAAIYAVGQGINVYPWGIDYVLLGLIFERYYYLKSKFNFYYANLLLVLTTALIYAYPLEVDELVLYLGIFTIALLIINIRERELKRISNQAKKTHNYQKIETRLSGIEKVIQLMSSNLEVEETYQELLDLSCNLLNVGAGGFMLKPKDRRKTELELRVMRGLGRKHFIELDINNGQGCLGELYNSSNDFLLIDLKDYKEKFDAKLFLEDGFQSMLAIKISLDDKKEGIIFFLHYDMEFFSCQDKKMISSIIEYAPLMLNKAEVFEKMERNVAGLSTLQRTSNTINSTLDLEEVFALTVDVIMGTMGVSMAKLFILNDELDELELVASSGIPANEKERIISVSRILAKNSIENDRQIIKDEIDDEFIDRFGLKRIKSIVCIPLKVRGEAIGTINAAQIEFFRNFKEADKRFLATLANQIAIAIENARMYNQMEELATKDGLTKLYNHSHFQEILDREIDNAELNQTSLSLLMMDIDKFKNFNDTYGHQVGDEVLKELASLLQREVRGVDTVARYGGEEFSIILPGTDEQEAYQVASRINQSVRDMIVSYEDLELKVTISIGVSSYELGGSKKELINRADQACYKAKSLGRDQAFKASNLELEIESE